ncbi:MAG: type II toxin-antitoxin system VapC family toxin [Archaeoglobus sp.]|nr:type II toxin-antitoxin system VapC family toxin [Archaeoglobus sp.]
MLDGRLFDSSAIINLCGRGNLDKFDGGYTLNLAIFEIGNAVWKQVYLKRRIETEEGLIVLEVLTEIFENLKKIEVSARDVLMLAIEEGLTFYDAAYLHAAIKNNLTLVTDDDRLFKIAKKHVRVLKSREV